MIVNNMNLHEVWDNIVREIPKLDWKRDALFPKTSNEIRRKHRGEHSELACLLSFVVVGNRSSHWIHLTIHRDNRQLAIVEQ